MYLLKLHIKIKIAATTALILKCHFTAQNNNLSPKLSEVLCTEYFPDSANFQNSFKWIFFQILIFFAVLVYEKLYMDDNDIRGITTKTRIIVKDEPVLGDHLLCLVLVPTIQKRHKHTG